MLRHYQPPNFLIMDAIQLRTNLLQQIEQADEKLLRVISSVLEAVKVEYVAKEAEEEAVVNYADHLEPMTRQEMKDELAEAMTDYERGDYVTLEEMEKESATW